MSMVPARDPAICPVCGEHREGGCHPCPGPRVDRLGDFAYVITRRLDDVHLPEEVPDA